MAGRGVCVWPGVSSVCDSTSGVCAQFVKDTELEGGNTAPSIDIFVDMTREALGMVATCVRGHEHLAPAVVQANQLLQDAAAAARFLRKVGNTEHLVRAIKWYRDNLLSIPVRVVQGGLWMCM